MSSDATSAPEPTRAPTAVSLVAAAADRVAAALCAMVNTDVDVRGVDALVAGAGRHGGGASFTPGETSAVRLGLSGDLEAMAVVLVGHPSELASVMGVPNDLVDSAVAEVANILASQLVLGFEAAGAGRRLSLSPPTGTTDPEVIREWLATSSSDGARLQLAGPGRIDLIVLIEPASPR